MGMYTLFHCNVRLVESVPEQVVSVLKDLVGGENIDTYPDHKFFKCERKDALLRCSSAYFEDAEQGMLHFGKESEYEGDPLYCLRVSSSLKNYDSEIKKFVDWIKPYLKDGIIYSRYEESTGNEILYSKNCYNDTPDAQNKDGTSE